MKIKRKKVNRWLKKQSEILPAEVYQAFHKYQPYTHFSDPELDENGNKKEPEPLIGYVEQHPVNHYRRMKRLYQKQGLIGVQMYLMARGFEISNENKAETNNPKEQEVAI